MVAIVCGHQNYANIVYARLSYQSRHGRASVVPKPLFSFKKILPVH
jgi:hypothetical protein